MDLRVFFRSFVALFLLNIAAWASGSKPEEPSTTSDKVTDYLLQPSDLLHIQVFQEEDLTREVRISQEYTVTLPLIGPSISRTRRYGRQKSRCVRFTTRSSW